MKTARTLDALIDLKLARAMENYQQSKATFLDKCTNQVGWACDGFLKDVLVAEATWGFICELSAMTRGEDGRFHRPGVVRTMAERRLKDHTERIIRHTEFEANSTSGLHNLQRCYEAIARCKFIEWLKDALEESECYCQGTGS